MVLMRLRLAPLAPACSRSNSSYSAICSSRNALLVVPRHADPLETAVGDDDAVPFAAGDLGGKLLAAVAGQFFLGSDQELGIGIKLHELAGKLLQQVIGDDVHRLFDEPGLLHLHAGGGHREGLARTDDVGQQRVAGTHAPPHGVVLVRAAA